MNRLGLTAMDENEKNSLANTILDDKTKSVTLRPGDAPVSEIPIINQNTIIHTIK